MIGRNEVRLTIITVIIGVMLAVLYDALQEYFRLVFSQSPIGNNLLLVSVYSKAIAGIITILAGLGLLVWIFRKYLKRPEV